MLEKELRKILVIGESLSSYSDKTYISKEEKNIKPDELSLIGMGHNYSVWKYKDKNEINALKIFFSDSRRFSLSYDCYGTMKNLPLKRTIKAKETFYESTCKPIVSDKLDAYTMDYIEELKDMSLLEIPTSILVENVKLLEEDVKILAENGVGMGDVSIDNSILNKKLELFLSDIDMYRVDKCSSEECILKRNKIELNYFIKSYFESELERLEMDKVFTRKEYNLAILQLYASLIGKTSEIEIYKSLEKLFSNYETPKEYFLSLRKQ